MIDIAVLVLKVVANDNYIDLCYNVMFLWTDGEI